MSSVDNEPLGGEGGDRGRKGEEDQLSAENSGIEDSKDRWDGLGHQVSIVFHSTLLNTPIFPDASPNMT